MFDDNKEIEFYHTEIEDLKDSDKIKEALEHYEKIIAHDPNNTVALYCKAEALSALGETDQAINTLMEAVKKIAKLAKDENNPK